MTILFTGKIRCGLCHSNFKSKKERGVRKYLCSRYENYNKCERHIISEQKVLELLDMRYKRMLTKEEIDQLVDYVLVTGDNIEIFLKDGNKPIKLLEKYAQF